MSTALPRIDQTGKPASVAGNSRDDLNAYTVAGTELQLNDGGVGAVTWQWQLLDSPTGTTPTFVPNANVKNPTLVGCTLAGSYLLQLTVDGGGSVGQIYQIIAGVQVVLPSWITSVVNANFRIPAFGETTQFNVVASPNTGANARGWADDVNKFLSVLAGFGFGIRVADGSGQTANNPHYQLTFAGPGVSSVDTGAGVATVSILPMIHTQQGGVATPGDPHGTLNFTGAGVTVTDAGSGVVNISIPGGGGGSGVTTIKNQSVTIGAGPWTTLQLDSPDMPIDAVAIHLTSNAEWRDLGGGSASLHVTNIHHQNAFHSPGIYTYPGQTQGVSLKPTVAGGPLQFTLSFAAINAGDQVVTSGRVYTASEIAAPIAFTTYPGPGAPGSSLHDILLDTQTGALVVHTQATTPTRNVGLVIFDYSPTHPAGTFNLTTDGAGNASWDGGPKAQISTLSGPVWRLYHPNLVDWVDVSSSSISIMTAGTDAWSMTNVTYGGLLPLARAPLWYGSGAAGSETWGYLFNGTQNIIDLRPLQTIQKFDRLGNLPAPYRSFASELRWQSGVVFDRRMPVTDLTKVSLHGGFALACTLNPAGDVQAATGINPGTFWLDGLKYEVTTGVDLPTLSLANGYYLFCAVLHADGTTAIEATLSSAGNVVTAMKTASVSDSTAPPNTPRAGYKNKVPLYFGQVITNTLLVAGRIDLRRDVAFLGQWTVGSRDYQVELSSFDSGQPYAAARARSTYGDLVAEYESVAAALAWHGALTGRSDAFSGTGGSNQGAPLWIKVIRSTFEPTSFQLWSNVTIQGFGQPSLVFIAERNTQAFFQIGGGNNGVQQQCYNIKVLNLNVVVNTVPSAMKTGTLVSAILPAWDPTNPVNTPQPNGCNILLENLGLYLLNGTNLDGSGFAAIRIQSEAASGGMTKDGRVLGLTIRGCTTIGLVGNTTANDHVFVEHGIEVLGKPGSDFSTTPGQYIIENNVLTVQDKGIMLTGAVGEFGVWVNKNNVSCVRTSNTIQQGGIVISSPSIQGLWITDNFVASYQTTSLTGSAMIDIINASYVTVRGNAVFSYGVSGAMPGMLINTLYAGVIEANTVASFKFGVVLGGTSGSMVDVSLLNNLIQAPPSAAAGFKFSKGIVIGDVAGASSIQANNLRVSGNHVNSFRTGIYGDQVLSVSNNISIENNFITGQIHAGTADGDLTCRGVFLRVFPNSVTPLNMSISRNKMQDFAAAGSTDLTPTTGLTVYGGGGIIVASATDVAGDTLRDISICENQISMGHQTGVGYISIAVTGVEMAGVAIYGRTERCQIKHNEIINTKVATDAGNGAILVDALGQTSAVWSGLAISNNLIRWVSGAFTGGASSIDSAAGVLLRGNVLGAIISNNSLTMQSVFNGSATSTGYAHGIVCTASHALASYPQRMSILSNIIAADVVDQQGTTNGAIGVPVWIRGTPFVPRVCDNRIYGSWQHSTNGPQQLLEPNNWAGISLALAGSEGVIGGSISRNSVYLFATGGSDLAGPRLSGGIHVGSVAIPDAVPAASFTHICINDNDVNVVVDSSFHGQQGVVAGSSGGIVVDSETTPSNIPGIYSEVLVDANNVVVNDIAGASPVARGIRNNGSFDAQITNNVVEVLSSLTLSMSVEDVSYASLPTCNIWSNNRFGTRARAGTHLFGVLYQPQTSLNNWSGTAFFLAGRLRHDARLERRSHHGLG